MRQRAKWGLRANFAVLATIRACTLFAPPPNSLFRTCNTSIIGLIALLSLTLAPQSFAQSFDVASVKIDNGPLVPGVTGRMRGGPGTSDPGRYTATQQDLKVIITTAYGVRLDQISGPAWFDDPGPNFTITATMPPDTTKAQFQLMLQNLLAERFHLALHHETRNFPGYDLVVAPGGLKLKPWAPDPNGIANQPREIRRRSRWGDRA